WIDASAERLIHQAVGQLAKELSYCDHPEDLTSHEVLELFERSHQKWPSLLVLDNVLTPEIALSSVPRSPDFHLLITSRNPLWLGTAQMIEVLPLQQETSIDFLIARSGDNDRTAATELCKQLGNLPIALEQAGRYIERTACGIKHYSTEFEERRRRAEKFDDESERAIAAVWSLSMRRLLYENPFASTVLRALSYWGPHRIPREFLLLDAMQLPLAMRILSSTLLRAMRFMARWVKGLEDLDESFDVDIFDLNRTLESLRRYGLLEVNPDDVCLHPLVRSVVRCQIAVLQRPFIIRVSVLLLKSSLTKVRRVDEKSKLWCLHVVDIGQSVEEELITQKDLVPLLIQAAQLTAAGSEEKKEIITETLERALRCCTALREKKRNNWDITCLLQLAAHSRDNDEYKKAAEYLCQAIDRLDEIKDRVSLLPEVMSEYAEILLSEYETHYAGRFCEAAMAIERKRTNGSPTLIRLLAEYSEILRVAGEYDAAEAAALEGLALAQTVSRENTFEVARLKFLIGKIQSCKGDSETARRHLEVAFSSIEQDFGAESPYLKSIGSELEFLNNLELRQAAAQIFQTPRTDESESWAKEVQSFSVREPFVDAYELACEAAFEHLQHIAMPALIRAGLADARSEDLSLYPALEASVASKAELGKVLSSVIVPIYKAIADDPLWTEGGQLFDIFREEILTQYSVSFRMRMFWHLPTDGNWGEFLDTSPSFEDYISLFENNVSNFFEMVPECLISFEKDLLAGELSGCRAGVYGATLRFDAGFYLNRFLRYADLDGSA
ncbi:MAG TPA: hypothetical protein VHQ94_00555, partial [Pyrinomonadaceae bacterium]|nr:hypothetical protein [Pyrinomonadaceae bacterium]